MCCVVCILHALFKEISVYTSEEEGQVYNLIILFIFSLQINLTTSPAAAQLISRAQSISSTPTSISQQAVLLGSPSSPTLTASQAQMYLRAQMVRLRTQGVQPLAHLHQCAYMHKHKHTHILLE